MCCSSCVASERYQPNMSSSVSTSWSYRVFRYMDSFCADDGCLRSSIQLRVPMMRCGDWEAKLHWDTASATAARCFAWSFFDTSMKPSANTSMIAASFDTDRELKADRRAFLSHVL